MSIVSASIQLCKTVRDLAFDMLTSHHRDKLRMCTDSVERAASQLTELLNKYSIKDYSVCRISPDRSNGKLLEQNRNSLVRNNEDKDFNDDCNSTSVSGSENSGHSSASR